MGSPSKRKRTDVDDDPPERVFGVDLTYSPTQDARKLIKGYKPRYQSICDEVDVLWRTAQMNKMIREAAASLTWPKHIREAQKGVDEGQADQDKLYARVVDRINKVQNADLKSALQSALHEVDII
ncbi:uncharacterized protein PGRI_038350 [Penicillium griseofulvum]|uniref:Uncharacterized protein n=1 Tax=Penicillium patulum TaxID=5078 RepID=A0A135LDP5_PENPA|nr:uncharacterized protein PGRI_038350 [Penicillium griseofulvum]KXG47089.1 hypothetical protein PGRI_038350 [Penicillium griseofulvum]